MSKTIQDMVIKSLLKNELEEINKYIASDIRSVIEELTQELVSEKDNERVSEIQNRIESYQNITYSDISAMEIDELINLFKNEEGYPAFKISHYRIQKYINDIISKKIHDTKTPITYNSHTAINGKGGPEIVEEKHEKTDKQKTKIRIVLRDGTEITTQVGFTDEDKFRVDLLHLMKSDELFFIGNAMFRGNDVRLLRYFT